MTVFDNSYGPTTAHQIVTFNYAFTDGGKPVYFAPLS
jgi:hypothetical protein